MTNKNQHISPQLQLMLQAKKAKPVFKDDADRLQYVRKNLSIIGKSFSFKKVELEKVEDIKISARDGYELTIRHYFPNKNSKKVLLYFFGGGFLSGSLETHDSLCRKIAKNSGWVVAAVGYRLAPEYKFPIGVYDSMDAYNWIQKQKYQKVVVGGDSAGGNRATVVSHLCKNDKKLNCPDAQIMICPAIDLFNLDYPSYFLYGNGYALDRNDVVWGNTQYFNNEKETLEPTASPVFFKNFKDLPKTLIITAEMDVLNNEAYIYSLLLKNAGVEVQYHQFDNVIHDFVIYARLFKEANQAIELVAKFLNEV
jgi:acetyl esterase